MIYTQNKVEYGKTIIISIRWYHIEMIILSIFWLNIHILRNDSQHFFSILFVSVESLFFFHPPIHIYILFIQFPHPITFIPHILHELSTFFLPFPPIHRWLFSSYSHFTFNEIRGLNFLLFSFSLFLACLLASFFFYVYAIVSEIILCAVCLSVSLFSMWILFFILVDFLKKFYFRLDIEARLKYFLY